MREMLFSVSCVASVLACCAHVGESRRNFRAHPKSKRPLSSMLLATGPASGYSQIKGHSGVSGRPKMQVAVAPTKDVAVAPTKDVSGLFGINGDARKQLIPEPKVDEIIDHKHQAVEEFRRKLMEQHQREEDEGVNLMRHIYELKQKKIGTDHPETLTALFNYADVLCSAGRHAEAEPLKKHLLEVRRRDLGEEHVDTLRSMSTYAETLMALHREAEAEPLQKRALEMLKRSLGPKHADTIKASRIHDEILTKMSHHVAAEPRHAEKRKMGLAKGLRLSADEVKAARKFQRLMAMA